eukprot:6184208-Pleurochrysis_carterae.AAC.1
MATTTIRAALFACALVESVSAFSSIPTDPSIVGVAQAAGQFSTLLRLVGLVDGLAQTLALDSQSFTLFAPTDDAFAKLSAETLTALENDPTELERILQYHVHPGVVYSSSITDGFELGMLSGTTFLTFSVSDGVVTINDSAEIITPDVSASNGVIHIIDTVLIPPGDDPGSLVDVAASVGGFSTLLALATSANLASTLASGGPFTLFAPTDAAFAKLDPELVATLTAPENVDQLVSVLQYHLIDGAVFSQDLVDGMMPATLNGATVTITLSPVRVNDANVTTADIVATNGVIHVVDTVLVPPVDASSGHFESGSGDL